VRQALLKRLRAWLHYPLRNRMDVAAEYFSASSVCSVATSGLFITGNMVITD
jgi:hypothetical protein